MQWEKGKKRHRLLSGGEKNDAETCMMGKAKCAHHVCVHPRNWWARPAGLRSLNFAYLPIQPLL